jgi:hypothetical protein
MSAPTPDKRERNIEFAENKEQIYQQLDTLWQNYIQAVNKSRDSIRKQVNELIELENNVKTMTAQDRGKAIKSLIASIKKAADEGEKQILDILKTNAVFSFYREYINGYYHKYESADDAIQDAVVHTLVDIIAQSTDKSNKKLYSAKTYQDILCHALTENKIEDAAAKINNIEPVQTLLGKVRRQEEEGRERTRK